MQPDIPADVHAGFYQLSDRLALDYQLIDAPTAEQAAAQRTTPLFRLLGELQLLDHESQHLLRQIGERDRVLAACLRTFGKRLDLLGEAVALQLTENMGEPVPVTLSEAGLTFPAARPLMPGQWLCLKLLLSASSGIATVAQIVDCVRDSTSGDYLIQVSFLHDSDAQRQLLARYIVQKQAQDIRAAKHNERTST